MRYVPFSVIVKKFFKWDYPTVLNKAGRRLGAFCIDSLVVFP